MRQLPLVLQVTRSLNPEQQASIVKCLKIMSHGMHEFQRKAGLQGLATLHDMDRYCYCVAGVVGEMLTEMFVDFEPALRLIATPCCVLAVSFGQGLQMTNILKDQWEDRTRGACWLPQDMFARHGVNLSDAEVGRRTQVMPPRCPNSSALRIRIFAMRSTTPAAPRQARGRSPLLPVGHRHGAADAAQSAQQSRFLGRHADQDFA
jgi:phytoene/squalene synthetase